MSAYVGSKGVGSKNLCKTNETQRAHGQRKSFAVEQRWHPGMGFFNIIILCHRLQKVA